MLAQASSDAGTRLRRSKSTSTVHRPPPPALEPLDPDLARQQAVAAATAAFVRAQAQVQAHDAAERKARRSSDMSRSKSNASRKSTTSQGQGSHFPPRDSSFRSLHPPNPAQNADATRQSRSSTMKTEKFPSFHPEISTSRPVTAPRPLSTQPSIAFSEHSRPTSQPKAGPRSAAASITSQQIRKARSMYYASSVQTGSPIARPPAKYLTTPPPVTVSPALEVLLVPPPTRNVDPPPRAEPRIPVTVTADESVDKARDKVLQDFQQRSVKHKPSLFMAPFIKRQEKGKDKSKRLSSGYTAVSVSSHRTPNDSTADVTLNDFMPQPEKKDKRSFSGSLKSKIKRVFGRTSKPSPDLPVQQIEASREYFDNIKVEGVGNVYAIPSPDDELLQRIRQRTPSLDGVRQAYLRSASRTSSNGSLRSKGSNRSLHSEMNVSTLSASRVTSWGTTVTGDTLTQRAMKRMSVIHEAKDSIGSEADRLSSISTKRKSLPPGANGALAAFRDPMPMESLLEESSTPVDPKRVFSALMKEIGSSKKTEVTLQPLERTPGAESDVFESSTTKTLHANGKELHSSASRDFRPSTANDVRPPSRRPPSAAAQSTRSKESSMRSLGRAIRSTIRTVTPGEHHSSPCPEQPNNSDHEDSTTLNTGPIQQDCATAVFSPSASQIERRVALAKGRWKTPLEDAEKLHLPRETDRAYNVANFERAFSDELELTVTEHIEVHRTDVPEPPEHPTPSPRPIMSPLSPSVYSRNTDGVSILPNDSVMSFQSPEDVDRRHNGGSAVILTSQSVRSYVVGTTPSPRRSDSTRSSRDWKAWLSHEVSSMAHTSQEELKIDERYMTPPGKHRRESTRTSDTDQDDTTVILRPSCDTVIACGALVPPPVCDETRPRPVDAAHAMPEQRSVSLSSISAVLEKSQSQPSKSKQVTPDNSPPVAAPAQKRGVPARRESTPLLDRVRLPSSSHASSASQPLIETPVSARMNERFPYIVNARRYSNNSSQSSRQSKSPPESLASSSLKSSKATPSPRIYSDLSIPLSDRTSQRAPNLTLRRSAVYSKSKENVTPPSADTKRAITTTPFGPKPAQLLSSVALNRSSTNIGQYTSNAPDTKHAKHASSPAATPPRAPIRATVRAISPDKSTRRPKSAFDLRNSGARRPPALHAKSSLAFTREPCPVQEDRAIDSVLEDGRVTPGHRMADKFLRERKSTPGVLEGTGTAGVTESEKKRGGLRLVREDTPAFL